MEITYKGLANIGATCYMNSLLQILFMSQDFRNEIYKWKFDPKIHGQPEDSILYQLQKLFAKLETNFPGEVDPRELTKSFQWGGEEVLEQQDIQEFNRVLFDAIQQSLADNNKENLFLKELYEGVMVYYTRCRVCKTEHPREECFQDLLVTVKNKYANIYNNSLELGIQRYLKPEILQGSNLYNCEVCQTKVEAERFPKFIKLPKHLSFVLQRFTYDYNLGRQKINDEVKFPWILNMNEYMQGYQGIPNLLSEDVKCQQQPEFKPAPKVPFVVKKSFLKASKKTVLPNNIKNKPSANTRSFIMEMKKKTGKSREIAVEISSGQRFEDLQTQLAIQESLKQHNQSVSASEVTTNGHSQGDLKQYQSESVIMNGKHGTSQIETSINDKSQPQSNLSKHESQQLNSQKQTTSTTTATQPQKKTKRGQITPQMRIQYDANLQEHNTKIQQLIEKYSAQGQLIYELNSVIIHNGGPHHGHYYAYIKSPENGRWYCFNDYNVTEINLKEIQSAMYGSSGVSTNAYGLYYKQVETKESFEKPEPIPQYIIDVISKQKETMNKVQQDKVVNEQKYLKLKIYYQLYVKQIEVVNTFTLNQCLETAKLIFGEDTFRFVSPQNTRLRLFNPINEAKLDTYTGRENQTLAELKINSHKCFLIEVKKPEEVFEEYAAGMTWVRVVPWDSQTPVQSLQENYLTTHKITFPVYSNIQQIAEKIRETLKIDTDVAIVKKHINDGFCYPQILTAGQTILKTMEEVGLYENQILFVEPKIEALNWVKEFEAEAHRVTIKYNIPIRDTTVSQQEIGKTLPVIQESIVLDSRQSFGTAKKTICTKHGLDPEEIIVKRGSKCGLELKSLTQTLAEYRFITGSQLYLEWGIPAKPGEVRVILHIAKPQPLDSLNSFHTFEEVGEVPLNGYLKASECKDLFVKVLQNKGKYDHLSHLFNAPNRFRIRQKLAQRMTKIYREVPLREQQLIEKRAMAIQQIVQGDSSMVDTALPGLKEHIVYVRVFDPQNWTLGGRFEVKIGKAQTLWELAQAIHSVNQAIKPEDMDISNIVALYKFHILDLAQCEVIYQIIFICSILPLIKLPQYYSLKQSEIPVSGSPLFIVSDGLIFVVKNRNKKLRELTKEQELKFGGTLKPSKAAKSSYKPPIAKKQTGIKIQVKKANDTPKQGLSPLTPPSQSQTKVEEEAGSNIQQSHAQ